jgi:hypothetical protein
MASSGKEATGMETSSLKIEKKMIICCCISHFCQIVIIIIITL